MPAVQVVNTSRAEPEPSKIPEFFSKIQKVYKDKEDKVEIDNLLSEYQQNREDANALENLFINLEKSNVAPSKRLETLKNLKDIQGVVTEKDKNLNAKFKENQVAVEKKNKEEKETLEKTKKENEALEKKTNTEKEVYEILKESGESEDEALRKSKFTSPATARSLLTKTSKAPPVSQFQKTLQAEGAKKVVKLEDEIPKSKDALKNIDRVVELSEKHLRGLTGYAKSFFNTEAAAEVRNLSATNLDTVIKLFNPAGTLPTAKLNWIKDTFSVSPSDNISSIRGKTNVQKIIAEQALGRAQEKLKLLKRYEGNIPLEEDAKFDKDTENLLDVLQEQLEPKEKKDLSELPPADKHEGKTIKDNNTGKMFISNGKEWVPK